MKEKMKLYKLQFRGYTWDEYFYVIADKPGIIVVYSGCLDREGTVRLDEVLYIGESDSISSLYESNLFHQIRKSLKNGERLFFSYTEIREGRVEITQTLNYYLHPKYMSTAKMKNVKILCSGACALFPNELLIKQ